MSWRLLPTWLAALLSSLTLTIVGCPAFESQGELPGPQIPSQTPIPREAPLPRSASYADLHFALAPGSTDVPLELFESIGEHLETSLGISVHVDSEPGYDPLAEALVSGQADIALLPPLLYVLAERRQPAIRPIATVIARGTTSYSSVLVVRGGEGLENLQDLHGKRLTFVDPSSASGFLFPYVYLLDRGLDPEKDFAEVRFSGTHPGAIQDLAEHRTDLIATFPSMLHALDVPGLVILARTGRIPFDTICAGPSLDEARFRALQHSFARLNTQNIVGRQLFRQSHKITGWLPTEKKYFEPIVSLYDRVASHQSGAPRPRHDGGR